MGAGATTAGLQTYFIGKLAIEICKNGGIPLDHKSVESIKQSARESYDAFIAADKSNSNIQSEGGKS
jgi:protein-tyrosine-phosphatase